jgi:hypothetical protein
MVWTIPFIVQTKLASWQASRHVLHRRLIQYTEQTLLLSPLSTPCTFLTTPSSQNSLPQHPPSLHYIPHRPLHSTSQQSLDIYHSQSTLPKLPRATNRKHKRQRPNHPLRPPPRNALARILNVPVVPPGESASSPEVNLRVRINSRVPPIACNVPA